MSHLSMKIKYLLTGLLLLLTACASEAPAAVPVSQRVEPASASLAPSAEPTTVQAASPTAALSVAQPKTKIISEIVGCSAASRSESVLLTYWDDRSSTSFIVPVDPTTGQALCSSQPLDIGSFWVHAAALDGSQLAIVRSPKGSKKESSLTLLDLKSWQISETGLQFGGLPSTLLYSSDGKQLAVFWSVQTANGRPLKQYLSIVDPAARALLAEAEMAILPLHSAYTADGTALLVYGARSDKSGGEEPYALRINSADLSLMWETPLSDLIDGKTHRSGPFGESGFLWYGAAAVLDPQKERLYLVAAESDQLSTIDFANRTSGSVAIRPAQTWLDRFMALTAGPAYAKVIDGTQKSAVLSPDGSRLYIAGVANENIQDKDGNWQLVQTPLDLQVVEIATGLEISRLETEATELAISADGALLFLRGWNSTPWTQIVDRASLTMQARLTGRYFMPARRLNGAPLGLSSFSYNSYRTSLAVYDPLSGKEIKAWKGPGNASWLITP